MIKKLKAYLHGMWEFRQDFTTHYGWDLIDYYDRGRDMAHRLTFRHWDC